MTDAKDRAAYGNKGVDRREAAGVGAGRARLAYCKRRRQAP